MTTIYTKYGGAHVTPVQDLFFDIETGTLSLIHGGQTINAGGASSPGAAYIENDNGGFVVPASQQDAVIPFDTVLWNPDGLVSSGTTDIPAPRPGIYQVCYEVDGSFSAAATGTVNIAAAAISPQTGTGHGRGLVSKSVTGATALSQGDVVGQTVPLFPSIVTANPGLVWQLLLSNLTDQDVTIDYAFLQVAYLG